MTYETAIDWNVRVVDVEAVIRWRLRRVSWRHLAGKSCRTGHSIQRYLRSAVAKTVRAQLQYDLADLNAGIDIHVSRAAVGCRLGSKSEFDNAARQRD